MRLLQRETIRRSISFVAELSRGLHHKTGMDGVNEGKRIAARTAVDDYVKVKTAVSL